MIHKRLFTCSNDEYWFRKGNGFKCGKIPTDYPFLMVYTYTDDYEMIKDWEFIYQSEFEKEGEVHEC